MGLLETGSEMYFSLFKLAILFSFIFIIFNSVFTFVDLSSLPQINWSVANLNNAVTSLQNAKGLDIAVAVPMLLVSILALMVESFLNSILLINWLIQQSLFLLLMVLSVSESSAVMLSSIASWIIILPALIGVITDFGRMMFYLLFGARR